MKNSGKVLYVDRNLRSSPAIVYRRSRSRICSVLSMSSDNYVCLVNVCGVQECLL